MLLRRCLIHHEPLGGPDGLTCPRGHSSGRSRLLDLRRITLGVTPRPEIAWEEPANWEIWDTARGRLVATVLQGHVEWEPWTVPRYDPDRPRLYGRTGAGIELALANFLGEREVRREEKLREKKRVQKRRARERCA